MRTKCIATALTLGFLAFTISTLAVTRAQAQSDCQWMCASIGGVEGRHGEGYGCSDTYRPYEKARKNVGSHNAVGDCYMGLMKLCCKQDPETKTLPVNPCEAQGPGYEYSAKAGKCVKSAVATPPSCAPGTTYSEREKRCVKPIKDIGKGSSSSGKGNAALKRACEAKGWRYEEHPAKCLKPSQVKADCDAKGPNYTYDLDTGGCVKAIEKVEPLKPSQRKAACEAKGPNYTYDLDTGGCVKAIAKAKPPAGGEE